MGKFLDNLIVRTTHFLEREKNERHALGWQRVVGKIARHAISSTSPSHPLVDYDYTFESQSYSGSFSGHKIRDEDSRAVGDFLNANALLHIRVNPGDPRQSRVLNRDNPRLPFEIDHLEN